MEKTKYQILRALEKAPRSFWALIQSQDSSLSEVTRTIGLMLDENQIVFDPDSRKFSLGKSSGTLPEVDESCPTCQGKGVILDGPFKEALDRFLEITTDRPPPIFEYNQGIIRPTDLALKAAVMYRRGDLEGRSILLLGDDDLFSIFLTLLDYRCTVTVLEIDERFIRYIKEKAESDGLSITARRYDINTPFPPDLRAAFDAFVTEPPEGLKGMRLFLGRAIDALSIRGAGYLGLTTLESSLPKWLAIQRFLMEKGMVITDLLRNFSLYPEADDPIRDYDEFPLSRALPVAPGPPDLDYFRSSLIRVEKTDPVAMNDDEGLYTDEETWVTVNPEKNE